MDKESVTLRAFYACFQITVENGGVSKNSLVVEDFWAEVIPCGEYRAFFFYLRSESWPILKISISESERVVSGSVP
jgi:hypothetical protein